VAASPNTEEGKAMNLLAFLFLFGIATYPIVMLLIEAIRIGLDPNRKLDR
jgi:hypothetical protein